MKPVRALDHIGIAVRSLDDQKSFYAETLGAEFEGIEEVLSQKVRVAFYKINDVRLELLEPTDPESPIAKFIEKRGEGMHHMAFPGKGGTFNIATTGAGLHSSFFYSSFTFQQ